MSLRIAVDACCWSNRRGFGRFTRELVSRMVDEHQNHEFTLVLDERTKADGVFPSAARFAVVPTSEQPTQAASASGARRPVDLWRLSRAASRLRADVIFFPAVYSYYPILRRVPLLVAFHDVIAESHPGLIFQGARARLFWALKCRAAASQSTALLTVSSDARSRIARTFRYPEERIHVVREAPSPIFRRIEDPALQGAARRRWRLPPETPLILYVGGISPHKNLAGLLDAFALIATRSPAHLALVGDYSDDSFLGCHSELVAKARALSLEDRITFTGFVPDEDLAALYGAATLLVQPSFDEGFGLPVAEAMACGLPVAASRRGSLPELLGPDGLYFDPTNAQEMSETLLRLLEDPALRREQSRIGLLLAREFSWSQAAARTVSLLEEIARG